MAIRYTEAQVKEQFSLFDRDGTGEISSADLGMLIRSLGENPTQAQVVALAQTIDSNSGGNLDFQGFLKLMNTNQFDQITTEELIAMFRAFDADGQGKLLAEDIKQVMTSGGEKLTTQQADEILDDFRTEDGYIDYTRFAEKLLTK